MKLSNPLVLLAFAAEKSGFRKAARTGYLIAGKSFNSPDAWFRLGREALQNADWQNAADNFKQAVRCNPNDPETQFKLGYCQLKLSSWNDAKISIGRALELDPGKTQWRTQYNQALAKIKKPSVAVSKKPVVRNMRDISRVLKAQTLMENFAGFDELHALILSLFAIKEPVAEAQLALLLAERHAAEGNHEMAHAIAETMDPSSPYGALLKGMLHMAEGKHQAAMDHIQEYLVEYPDDETGIRLMARAARLSGHPEIAWRVLSPALKVGSQSLTWKEAALLIENRTDLDRLQQLWNEFTKSGKPATNHFRIARHVASAAVRAGEHDYAGKLLKESAIALRARKVPSPSEYYSIQSHPEYPNLPDTTSQLDGIVVKSLEPVTERFSRAMIALVKLLDSAGIEHFAIGRTLGTITRKGVRPGLWDCVEFGISGELSWTKVHALLDASTSFVQEEAFDPASLLIEFSHVNGVGLKLYLHTTSGGTTWCRRDGVEWTTPAFRIGQREFRGQDIPIPEDPKAYLREFSDGGPESLGALDCMISAKNATVADKRSFKFFLYHSLLEASMLADEAGVRKCVHKLHDLGEQDFVKAFYSKDGNCSDANLPQLLQDKPQVILYLSGLENVGYQGNMWIPVLEKFKARCAIAIRERRIAPQLINTTLPIYYFESMRDLELLEQAGVKTILYPANTQKNIQTLRFFGLNHFFINHGESDKVVNQSKFLMAYDKLLVAGPLAERRMRQAGLPLRDEQVVYVGRPQTELLLDRVTAPAKALHTIFYAPTWEGFVEEANYASINEFGLQMLQALASRPDFQVVFKPHPFTGSCNPDGTGAYLKQMQEFALKSGIKVIDAKVPIFECMKESDLLITDISSVLNDYLYTLKPMILTNPRNESHESLRENYPSSAATYILDDGADAAAMLDAIIGNDHMFEQRKAVCIDSLGDLPDGSLVTFERVVNESLSSAN